MAGVAQLRAQRMIVHSYFGPFVLDHERGQLRRVGEEQVLVLTAQPLKVLAFLVTRAGEIVSREELQKHVWGDTIVEYDQGLNACIRQIRAVLGDNADEPQYIQTLRGKGYRFLAAVSADPRPAAPVSTRRSRAGIVILGIIAAVLAAFAIPQLRRERTAVATQTPSAAVATAYTRGIGHLFHFDDPIHRDSARYFLMSASRGDYNYAPAVAGVSILFTLQGSETDSSSPRQTSRQVLARAVALAPADPMVQVARALSTAVLDKSPGQGQAIIDSVLRRDSTMATALYVGGWVARQGGQWSTALDRWLTAERIAPGATGAAYDLASAFAALRMWDRAAEWLGKAQRYARTPATGVLGVRIALARARTGDVLQAVRTCLGETGCARSLLSDPSLARRTASFLPLRDAPSAAENPRGLTALAEVSAAKLGAAGARAAYAAAHSVFSAKTLPAGHPERAWAGLAVIAGGEVDQGVALLVADTIATPMGEDVLRADDRRNALALGLVRAGRIDEAMDLVRRLLAVPGSLTIQELMSDPAWAPLRRHADFSELTRTWLAP